MSLVKRLHRLAKKVPNWLVVVLAIVLVLRIPSFFEPFSYGDEMIYLSLGEAVRRPDVVLYRDIHDNKPPLLYIFAGIAGNVFWFRVILAFWSLGTIVVFWKLITLLFPKFTSYKKDKFYKIATWIFAIFTTIPLLEGNIANSEIFMVGPTMLAFYLLLKSTKIQSDKHKNVILAGIFFAIATLFKVPAAFDLPVIVVYWLVTTKKIDKKSLVKIFKKSFYLFLGFAIPLVATFAWYYFAGALREYVVAAYLQNIGYLSSFRPGDVREPFFVRNAPLLFRAGIVTTGILLLYLSKKKLSKQFVFLSIWLLFSLFAIALSERPYPHYFIQALPTVSIFLAILFSFKNLEQSLVVIPLALAFFVPFYFKFWTYPVTSYYVRFFEFATGKINKEQYFDKFDGSVNRNYKIAEFVETTSASKDLFVWGNSSAIYALTRKLPPIKYVADYHISDFSNKKDVAHSLEENPPETIIVLPNSDSFPELSELLVSKYFLITIVDQASVWKLIN